MTIKIYGSGCPKCKKVYAAFEEVLKETGKQDKLIKVQDMNEIISSGIVSTPAVEIDGKVVSTGKVLSKQEVVELLR